MGVVLPFEPRATNHTIARLGAARQADIIDAEQVLAAAVRDGRDSRGILAAARPLLERCRDRYGFTVMQTGLPTAPEVLASALTTLAHGLGALDAELRARWPFWVYGVYFSDPKRQLTWFEDGYGSMSGLAVPIGIDAAELTRFVQKRIRALRR
jgi:hypothetical protein